MGPERKSWGFAIPAAAISAATFSSFVPHMQGDSMTPKPETVRNIGTTQTTSFVDEKYLNAKLEAVDARTETKFAQLLGELKAVNVNISGITTTVGELKSDVAAVKSAASSTKSYVIGTGIAIAGFIVAILAFGAQILGLATSLFAAGGT